MSRRSRSEKKRAMRRAESPATGDSALLAAVFEKLRDGDVLPENFSGAAITVLRGDDSTSDKKERFLPAAADETGSAPASRHAGDSHTDAHGRSTAWFEQRLEELDASLELAAERLQKSLKHQGELEATTAVAVERAERLSNADARAERLAAELSEIRGKEAASSERTRSLEAEKRYFEQEFDRLKELLHEREKNLAALASEAGSERLGLLDRILTLEERLAPLEAERAAAAARADVYREEAERTAEKLDERERALAEAAQEAARERARFSEELADAHRGAEEISAHASNEQARLREEFARVKAEGESQFHYAEELRTYLDEEKRRAADLTRALETEHERLREAESTRVAAERSLESLKIELGRLAEERDRLSQVVNERERTLRDELAGARQDRVRGEEDLARLRDDYETLIREHERAAQRVQALEADLVVLTESATRERERARSMSVEVVSLEDRIRDLTAQLERARTQSGAGAAAEAEKALRKEHEEAMRELSRLRSESERLSDALRQAERQAQTHAAARTELERRAEAAEQLVRERLRELAEASRNAFAQAGERRHDGSQSETSEKLLGAVERLAQKLETRLGEPERPAGPSAAASDEALRQSLARLTERSERALADLSGKLETLTADRGAPRTQTEAASRPAPADETASLYKKLLPAALAASLVLAVALAAGLLALQRRMGAEVRENRRILESLLVSKDAAAGTATAARLRMPRLTSPSAGSTVRKEEVRLQGEAPGADAVFLFLGESLFAVTLAREGRFFFDDVPLQSGKNKLALRAVAHSGAVSDVWETVFLRPPEPGVPAAPPVRDLLRGPKNRKEIALTFDADQPNGALAVLDVLRAHGIQTTIFLTGEFVEANPEIAKRVVADGHEVGNHTWNHPHLTTFDHNSRHDTRPEITKQSFTSQLIRTASRFEEITGKPMAPLWRAPFGEVNPELMRWAEELGYRHVNWTRDYERGLTLDSLDWVADKNAHNYFTNAEILQRLLSFGRGQSAGANGGIVLMHLGTQRGPGEALYEKLPDLIAAWRGEGYRFVKITKMLEALDRG